METEKLETEKIETKKIETEIPEQTLPKPQKKVETITVTTPAKKPRSAKQMECSRQLGLRSQEYKEKKRQRMISTFETPTNNTPTNDTPSPVKTTTPYLLYFTLIGSGLLVCAYYFLPKQPELKIEPVKKPESESKTASTLTKME